MIKQSNENFQVNWDSTPRSAMMSAVSKRVLQGKLTFIFNWDTANAWLVNWGESKCRHCILHENATLRSSLHINAWIRLLKLVVKVLLIDVCRNRRTCLRPSLRQCSTPSTGTQFLVWEWSFMSCKYSSESSASTNVLKIALTDLTFFSLVRRTRSPHGHWRPGWTRTLPLTMFCMQI